MDLEEELYPSLIAELSPPPFTLTQWPNTGRTTRGVNISSRYVDLMSKSRRDEVEQETLQNIVEPNNGVEPEVP